jgi:hypothetical protein
VKLVSPGVAEIRSHRRGSNKEGLGEAGTGQTLRPTITLPGPSSEGCPPDLPSRPTRPASPHDRGKAHPGRVERTVTGPWRASTFAAQKGQGQHFIEVGA